MWCQSMTHLNFGRNNGKPAAVTSWGLGDVGGQVEAWGGGNLRLEGGSCPPSTPQMAPLHLQQRNLNGRVVHHGGPVILEAPLQRIHAWWPQGRKCSSEAVWPKTCCHTCAVGDGNTRKEVTMPKSEPDGLPTGTPSREMCYQQSQLLDTSGWLEVILLPGDNDHHILTQLKNQIPMLQQKGPRLWNDQVTKKAYAPVEHPLRDQSKKGPPAAFRDRKVAITEKKEQKPAILETEGFNTEWP